MHSLKSPSLDGFQPLFYKKCWHIVGDEVIKEVQAFFINGILKQSWNSIFISLLPKNLNLIEVNHY